MSQETISLTESTGYEADILQAENKKARNKGIKRLARYTVVRLVALFFTVAVGVYLTILIANMGGAVDDIRRGQIREQTVLGLSLDPQFRQLPADERAAQIETRVALAEQRFGLDEPFFIRSVRYLVNAMVLDLGFAETLTSDSGSKLVRNVLLERLPSTLILFGTANLILFFMALFFALGLSRRYGSFIDKAVVGLAPTSAAPGWFYGLFLILIFASIFQVLPFGGMVSSPPPEDPLQYALSLGEHLILPVTAWIMGAIFLNIYQWRTFFLIYSSEDYVEMAKAKGLSNKMIERRYILRPTLPTIITSFALLAITLWSGAIIHETVFNWPGIGSLYFRAIGAFDTPVIVAVTVVYAYLLAFTVFLLDFVYALVDPRVRLGGGSDKK